MSPDKNDSQNEPKPEKKWELIKEGSVMQTLRWGGGGSLQKKYFWALQVLIWPTNKGGRAPSLYLPLKDSQASRPAREPLGERAKT